MSDLISAIEQVGQFGALPHGWDYGRGGPSPITVCARARSILVTLYGLGLRRFDVAPGINGGITVAALKAKGSEVEVQCQPNERYDLYVSTNGVDVMDEDGIAFTRLLKELRGISWLSTKSSTWFTPNVIYRTWNDSPASHSRTLPMVLGFRSFASNALSRRAGAYARTFAYMEEPTYAANPQSSGDLNARPLLLA